MKIKINGSDVKITDPWYIIALKTVAYLIGLLLAGVGTASAANISGLF